MPKIKVKLVGGEHSAGRGVGFYRLNLARELMRGNEVELVETRPDLVHYPFFDLFYPTLPQKLDHPTVVTIHDLTPLVLSNLYPLGLRARLALFAQERALKHVAAILTDSQSSKKDLIRLFHLDPDKVFVTPLAADPGYQKKASQDFIRSVKSKYHLPDRFLLYVGGVNANKNLVRLAKTAISLKMPLVLVGSEFTKAPLKTFSLRGLIGLQKTHPEIKEFMGLKQLIAGNPLFHTPGFVPTEELNAIYRSATLYCQPSLYEGFGLPLLEAMTAGCLVISSNTGSLPEIYPSGTLTFDPANQVEMESVLAQALAIPEKERATSIQSGLEKAKQFSWAKTAQLTYDVYRKNI
ncbi:MAG: glycosyltransferase family 1 protein [Microgenomates group bacterium]